MLAYRAIRGERDENPMRKTITRTITTTTIESAKVTFVKGELTATPNTPLVFNGTITEEKALKEVRKTYGEYSQLTNIVAVDNIYEISVEDFMKYAKLVEKPTEETEEENAE